MRNAVSLLPQRYKQENHKAQKLSVVVRAVSIVLVCVVAVAALTFIAKIALNSKLDSLVRKSDEAQATILQNAQYEQLLNQKNQIATKINAVRKLDKKWLSSIYDVSVVLPDGVGFNGLNAVSSDAGLSFNLDCNGNTLDDISKTLKALENSPAVSSVTCTSTRISDGGVSFSLTVILSGVSASEGGAQ